MGEGGGRDAEEDGELVSKPIQSTFHQKAIFLNH